MVIKYNECSERIKKHIKESKSFSISISSDIVLYGHYCDSMMIVNQLVKEGVISTDELADLLK